MERKKELVSYASNKSRNTAPKLKFLAAKNSLLFVLKLMC